MKACPHTDLFTNVYSSFICHSHRTETTQMSIGQRMDEQNVGYVYRRASLSHKKEQSMDNIKSQSNHAAVEETRGKENTYLMMPFIKTQENASKSVVCSQ